MSTGVRHQWAERLRWDLIPLYLGLSGLSMILGMLTIVVLAEHAEATAAIRDLEMAFGLLASLFGFWPFVHPVLGIAAERLLDRWRGGGVDD